MGICCCKGIDVAQGSKPTLDSIAQVTQEEPLNQPLQNPCKPFSLEGQSCLGYCVKAYDGDTCTINIHTHVGNNEWKVRLSGFDAPELKTKNSEEKKHGIACRDMLLELIHNKYVIVRCEKFEKYGRLLANVFIRAVVNSDDEIKTDSCTIDDVLKVDLLNVNQWMLKYTPCVPYDGGTKAEIVYKRTFHPAYLCHLQK
jgi:endonuclease YncB( thermonuclease family)